MSQMTKTNGIVAGVCGGIAKKLAINVIIIRGLFICLSWVGGAPILFYIILALVIPKEKKQSSYGTQASSNAPVRDESTIFCKSCGNQNDRQGKFCRKCGEPL